MVAACLTLLTVALLFLGKGSSVAASSIKLSESAFKLSHALMLALLMGGVSLLSAGLQALFGGAGVMVTAVVVAIVEVHAAASVAQMSLSSALPPSLASWSLVAVLASSAAAKTLLAWFSGGLAFGWRVGLGLWLMVLSATVTLVLPLAYNLDTWKTATLTFTATAASQTITAGINGGVGYEHPDQIAAIVFDAYSAAQLAGQLPATASNGVALASLMPSVSDANVSDTLAGYAVTSAAASSGGA